MAAPVLVFAFAPFGGEARNPSGEIAAALDGRVIAGARVRSTVLPVARRHAFARARAALRELRPCAVLGLGVADGRSAVDVERRAVNRDDGRDELGDERSATPIVTGGPDELFGPVDAEALAAVIRARGVPARTSDDAGTFLCNHVYYRLLRERVRMPADARPPVAFLHLPALPESVAARGAGTPSMALATTRRAVIAALRFLSRASAESPGLG